MKSVKLQYVRIVLLVLIFLPAAVSADRIERVTRSEPHSQSGLEITSETFWNFELKGLGGFFPASYNRVDGLLAGWGFDLSTAKAITYPGTETRQLVSAYRYPEVSFEMLVPSARRFVGGSLGIKQRLSEEKKVDLGLNLGFGTFSNDTWRADDPGTSLLYLTLERDRRYYHDRRGCEIFMGNSLDNGLSIWLAFYYEHVKSLDAVNVWTLFSSSLLTENPPVIHGADSGLRFRINLERLSKGTFFPEGWECALTFETGGSLAGGDFDYQLFDFSVGFFRLLGELNYCSAALKAVTAKQKLPPHKLYSLGGELRGIDTFHRDFDLFHRRGDRLWYISLGYQRLITLPDIFITRLAYNWSLDFYFTSGVTFLSSDEKDPLTLFTDGFENLESGAAVGVSCNLSRTRVGVYLEDSFKRQYRSRPTVTVRLSQSR